MRRILGRKWRKKKDCQSLDYPLYSIMHEVVLGEHEILRVVPKPDTNFIMSREVYVNIEAMIQHVVEQFVQFKYTVTPETLDQLFQFKATNYTVHQAYLTDDEQAQLQAELVVAQKSPSRLTVIHFALCYLSLKCPDCFALGDSTKMRQALNNELAFLCSCLKVVKLFQMINKVKQPELFALLKQNVCDSWTHVFRVAYNQNKMKNFKVMYKYVFDYLVHTKKLAATSFTSLFLNVLTFFLYKHFIHITYYIPNPLKIISPYLLKNFETKKLYPK